MSGVANKIFEHMPAHDQPGVTIKAIAVAVGIPYGAANMHLQQMEKRGMVWKLTAPHRPEGGRTGYVYVKADTTGYSHLMEPWEAEIVKAVEENPDKVSFTATFVHEKGYLDNMMGLTEWYPNRHEPFTHFHIVWSVRHTNYLSIPGCFLHGEKDRDDALEVEKFTDEKAAHDWLLTKGVALKRKGLLPDGRPVPKSIEELQAYRETYKVVEPEQVALEPVEVDGAFRCGHPKSPQNSKKKSGAKQPICRQCFEAKRKAWRARRKSTPVVDMKKCDGSTHERIQRIEIT